MGLFSKFGKATQSEQQITLGPAEAFAAIVLLVVAADGYLAQEEVSLLNTVFGRMRLFRSYSRDVVQRMLDKLCGTLQRQGGRAVFDAALASLPHDLYDTTFAIATDLALADGEVSKEEEALLEDLAKALEIPEATIGQIINVMLIKNKG